KVIIPGQAGLRVPKTALRTSVVNGAEVSGVYVLIGPEMEFRRVDVLMTDGDYVICNNNKKDGWLQLYDHVIVSGKNLDNDRVIRN
ncbi:MAG: HlyD family efflux transporter periplasmic adaptor subunit, partial [Bacillota bacterium]|nr:HlyD family efflux transporter periplasmic adaptor subunit [Bacillota bacterium]